MLATGRTSKIFDVETLGLELMRPSKKGPLRFEKNQKNTSLRAIWLPGFLKWKNLDIDFDARLFQISHGFSLCLGHGFFSTLLFGRNSFDGFI